MKRVIKIMSVLGFLVLMSFSLMADFFSTMTKVDYIEGAKILKFTTKINTDHISKVLKINPNTTAFDAEVKKYIGQHFFLTINGEKIPITFNASQVNGESVWVYFEASNVENIKNLKIQNTIFFEAYPKQFNVVNIAYKGQQKTMNFQKGKEIIEVSF